MSARGLFTFRNSGNRLSTGDVRLVMDRDATPDNVADLFISAILEMESIKGSGAATFCMGLLMASAREDISTNNEAMRRGANQRPLHFIPISSDTANCGQQFDYDIDEEPMSISVTDRSTGSVLFSGTIAEFLVHGSTRRNTVEHLPPVFINDQLAISEDSLRNARSHLMTWDDEKK